jgi:hypothetical protein
VISLLGRLLLVIYFVEAGLLLLVAPWSAFWERNLFVERIPWLGDTLTNHFVRGAVSGVGVICLAAAVVELTTFVLARFQSPAPDSGHEALGSR